MQTPGLSGDRLSERFWSPRWETWTATTASSLVPAGSYFKHLGSKPVDRSSLSNKSSDIILEIYSDAKNLQPCMLFLHHLDFYDLFGRPIILLVSNLFCTKIKVCFNSNFTDLKIPFYAHILI